MYAFRLLFHCLRFPRSALNSWRNQIQPQVHDIGDPAQNNNIVALRVGKLSWSGWIYTIIKYRVSHAGLELTENCLCTPILRELERSFAFTRGKCQNKGTLSHSEAFEKEYFEWRIESYFADWAFLWLLQQYFGSRMREFQNPKWLLGVDRAQFAQISTFHLLHCPNKLGLFSLLRACRIYWFNSVGDWPSLCAQIDLQCIQMAVR